MRTFFLLLMLATLIGCGGAESLSMAPGCEVTAVEGGYRVDCPGQGPVTLMHGRDGSDGEDGANGNDGSNGHAALIAQLPAGDACDDGGVTLLTALDTNDNLVLDSEDSNLQSATICNGAGGNVSPFSPVGLVDPCGTAPGIHNEVFFRLENRSLVASFSDNASGANTRFALLSPGTYVTTDGDQCVFTIDENFDVVNESHQSGD